AARNPRRFKDIGDAEIAELPFALLEEQNALVAGTIVISHTNSYLIPYQWFPELEPRLLGLRLGHEHRLGITEQIEVRLAPQHAVALGEQLGEPGVGKDREPVVARRLAVLEPRGRADRAMLLERLVRRIRDDEIDRLGRQRAQPCHGVALREVKRRSNH